MVDEFAAWREFAAWGECAWTARDLYAEHPIARFLAQIETAHSVRGSLYAFDRTRNPHELAHLDARVRAAKMRLAVFALMTLCAIVAVLLAVR